MLDGDVGPSRQLAHHVQIVDAVGRAVTAGHEEDDRHDLAAGDHRHPDHGVRLLLCAPGAGLQRLRP